VKRRKVVNFMKRATNDHPLAHPVRHIAYIEQRSFLVTPDSVILEHPTEMSAVGTSIESPRPSTYRLSMRASSPSIWSVGLAVTASRTKWLSQCGQYSSLKKDRVLVRCTLSWLGAGYLYLSSNSAASLRKHFLHFLQAKIYLQDNEG
jgi:hypothetical protein